MRGPGWGQAPERVKSRLRCTKCYADRLWPLPLQIVPPRTSSVSRTLHRKGDFFTIFRPRRPRRGDLLRSNQRGLPQPSSRPGIPRSPPMMVLHPAKPLFDWEALEDSPSLQTLKDLLAALPDAKLLDSLRRARGHGRNDYPVHVLWGVVVLRVVLRHITTEAVLAELRRNAGLRALIGIDSEAGVPRSWNISRFEDT